MTFHCKGRLWLLTLVASPFLAGPGTFIPGTSTCYCHGQEAKSDQYFGSKLPGKIAEPFAAEFFAKAGKANRFGMAISDDGRERYYAVAFREDGRFHEEIRFTRFENGAWTDPKPLLSEKKYKYVDPHFSPDGQELYFIYTKPAEGAGAPKQPVFDIWFINRHGNGWGEPVNIGAPISTKNANEYFVSLTSESTIYFGSNRGDSKNFDLYSAKLKPDGSYQTPKLLPGHVNTPNYEADVFVAPDESYVIFSSTNREGGHGKGDLYISFRHEDGTWRPAVNMGEQINSDGQEFAPSVSRDGKHLFFSRSGVIHWVDAAVIQVLRLSATH